MGTHYEGILSWGILTNDLTSMLNDIKMTVNDNFVFCFHTIIVFLVDSKDGNNKYYNDHNPRQHFEQY